VVSYSLSNNDLFLTVSCFDVVYEVLECLYGEFPVVIFVMFYGRLFRCLLFLLLPLLSYYEVDS
jgi:hypothetical protein